jgi:hypothetical protein
MQDAKTSAMRTRGSHEAKVLLAVFVKDPNSFMEKPLPDNIAFSLPWTRRLSDAEDRQTKPVWNSKRGSSRQRRK